MISTKLKAGRSAAGLILALVGTSFPAMAVNVLTATPATVAVTCSTATGPSAPVSVVIKPVTLLSGSSTIAVTFGAVTGLVITAPATTTLSTANQAAGITYTVTPAVGCVGTVNGANTLRFSAGGTLDVSVTVNVTLTIASTSSLVTNPTSVSLSCTKSGSTYTPGAAQTVGVTSATTGGTPFSIDTTTVPPPAWLTVTPTTGGTANATATNFSVVAASGCGGFSAGTTNTAILHLLNAPAPDKTLTVTLRIYPPTPLTFTPTAPSLSYTKGSGSPGRVDVTISSTSSPAPFFTVNAATMPPWLTVDSLSGTVPKSLRFSTTAVADTMAPGSYTTTVRVQVSNYADLSIPFSFLVNNPAAKLSVAEGTTRNITWTIGTPLPTPFVTAVSSDSPIPYSVDVGGPLGPIVAAANMKDLAYSFGTPIPVTFSQNIFAAALPGTVLEGFVALTWGSPASTITVTFRVTIQAPGATLSAISPASLPTAAAGQTFTLALTGNNFVTSTDPLLKTKVGVVTGSGFVVDSAITSNVVSTSTIILTIVVPSTASPNLPFSPTGTGGTVVLGVCNPSGATCSTPTGTASFAIGSNPIIQSVSSASSFVQVTAPTIQSIAPFDMISVFGANFCSSGGTGCASSDVLHATPDPVTLAYPTFLSPDASGATQRKLMVTFQTRASTPVFIANAPLLYLTNSQINLVVPAALSAYSASSVDMVITFGYGTGATLLKSSPFQLNVFDTNPGIFTVAANGQGDGAILSPTSSPIMVGAEAGMRSTATDSDTVQIFLTGLGVPNSAADNANAGTSSAWSGDCVSQASFLTSLNSVAASSLTTLDGVILSSSLLNTSRLVPCLTSGSGMQPSITIGGQAGVVTYAGWVSDSVAGLYQMNVRLPGSTPGSGSYTTSAGATLSAITRPVQLPVVVTSNSRTSQAGVNISVTRKLKVVAPTGAGLTGTVGVTWSTSTSGGNSNLVVATEGTTPYHYAVTSGLLPNGLSLNATTGAITGTPAVNTGGTYLVTVTATDSANFPISDKVSFTMTVQGGLLLTATGTSPYAEVYGTADATITTVSASGGTYPYTFALTGPSPLPVGLAIDVNTGVLSVANYTPAGTYHVQVTATDSAVSPLTGSITFDVVVALKVVVSTPVAATAGAASTITTATTTGQTGAITYTLDATTAALGWVAIDSAGVVTVTTGAVTTGSPRSVTITATDAGTASGSAAVATGTVTFTLTVN